MQTYTHIIQSRHVHYLILPFGVLPLFLLIMLFYFNYTRPVPTQHKATTNLAYRPKELVELNAVDTNVSDHGKFVTFAIDNKLETLADTGSKTANIADRMFALPKKILTWFHNFTGGTPDPESISIVDIPSNKSYAESYGYLFPRAAFFDKRARGNYKNATVILTHVIKSMVKPVGCIVDGYHIFKVELKALRNNGWIHRRHPECTYDNVFIFCFDTPGRNNSKVSIMYENPKNKSEIFIIDSEHPLFVPKSRDNSKEFASSVMACTTVFGTPPYFGAWLRYQKTIGVDLVYVNAAETFLCVDAYKDTFLQESIRNGFVQLKVWKEYLKPGALFYHSQALYYQNCLYRFQGVYNYAIMSDFDDFLIPVRGKDIGEILQTIFDPNPKLGSISLDWLRYFEPDGGFNYDVVLAGNFTQYIEAKPGTDEHNCKSIHKLSATSEVGIHAIAVQMKGYNRKHAARNAVYMAHFKNKQRPFHFATEQC